MCMGLAERQARLIKSINNIQDETVLEMLEQSLLFYTDNSKDITDGLTRYQLDELATLVNEPKDKDTITEDEYKRLTGKWRTK